MVGERNRQWIVEEGTDDRTEYETDGASKVADLT